MRTSLAQGSGGGLVDFLLYRELAFILALQESFSLLLSSMETVSSIGGILAVLLTVPLIYWCLDESLGLRTGILISITGGLTGILKLVLHTPRPSWVSREVLALDTTPTFALPSGHVLNSVAVLGLLALWARRRRVWLLAGAAAAIIGFSRLLLGAHFPRDLIIGALLGIIVLWIFLVSERRYAGRIASLPMARQVLLAFAASIIILLASILARSAALSFAVPALWIENSVAQTGEFNPYTMDSALFSAGSIFGIGAGAALMASKGRFVTGKKRWLIAARIPPGILGILAIWFAFEPLIGSAGEVAASALAYLQASLWGLWITLGAPVLFSWLLPPPE
jgi:membrane-associated phospholipid phosphatase